MWAMPVLLVALMIGLLVRARWLDFDLARRRTVFEQGGPLVLWAKAWPTTRPGSASYGDLMVSGQAIWWFEAGADQPVALCEVAVLDVRGGSRRLHRWLHDLSGWALVDLRAAGGVEVTAGLPDDQAAVLVDAVTRTAAASGVDQQHPAHRAPVAGKPPWWAWTSALAAALMVGGYVLVNSWNLPVTTAGAGGPADYPAASLTHEVVSAGVFAMGGALAVVALLGTASALVRALRVYRVKSAGGLPAVAAASPGSEDRAALAADGRV